MERASFDGPFFYNSWEWFDAINALLCHALPCQVRPLETIVDGFDKVPQAFVGIFKGDNLGKMLIKVTTTNEWYLCRSSDGCIRWLTLCFDNDVI